MTDQHDAIALITADHRRIEVLFKRLLLDQKDPEPTVAALHALLTAHFRAEEDVVYPLLDARCGFAQHQEAETCLDVLRRAAARTPEFAEALHRLVVSVMKHLGDEETTILPMLARSRTGDELAELGTAFLDARQRALDTLRGEPGRQAAPTGRFGTAKTELQQVITSL